jgi:hypothetical protein
VHKPPEDNACLPLSLSRSVCLSVCRLYYISLSVCLSVWLPFSLSEYLSTVNVCMSFHYFCLSCLVVCPSIWLLICVCVRIVSSCVIVFAERGDGLPRCCKSWRAGSEHAREQIRDPVHVGVGCWTCDALEPLETRSSQCKLSN